MMTIMAPAAPHKSLGSEAYLAYLAAYRGYLGRVDVAQHAAAHREHNKAHERASRTTAPKVASPVVARSAPKGQSGGAKTAASVRSEPKGKGTETAPPGSGGGVSNVSGLKQAKVALLLAKVKTEEAKALSYAEAARMPQNTNIPGKKRDVNNQSTPSGSGPSGSVNVGAGSSVNIDTSVKTQTVNNYNLGASSHSGPSPRLLAAAPQLLLAMQEQDKILERRAMFRAIEESKPAARCSFKRDEYCYCVRDEGHKGAHHDLSGNTIAASKQKKR